MKYDVWLSACYWGHEIDPEEYLGEWEAENFIEASKLGVKDYLKKHFTPEKVEEQFNMYFDIKDGVPYYWICKLTQTQDEAKNMRTVKQFNEDALTYWQQDVVKDGACKLYLGLSCPDCGKEVYKTNPGTTKCARIDDDGKAWPSESKVYCECGYSGYKINI
jgi:hypothetical protein